MQKIKTISFFVGIAFSFQIHAQCSIAKYLFNGNASDSSINSFHGIVYGAQLIHDRFGKDKSAYYFDGINDYVEIPHNQALNFATSDEFSVLIWFKPELDQVVNFNRAEIITKWIDEPGAGTNEGYPFALRLENRSGSDLGKVFGMRFDRDCGNFPIINSDLNLYDGNFHQIIFSKISDSLHLYIDGNQVSKIKDNTFCSTQNDDPIFIGRRGGPANASFFKGIIDHVEFFSCTVTPDPNDPEYQQIDSIQTVAETPELYHFFYPNPFRVETIFETLVLFPNAKLRLFNVLGQLVKEIEVTKKKMVIYRSDVSSGTYFYQFTVDDNVLFSGKIVSI